MEDPIRANSTLNENISKELIWRRNAPYFYQTLYTQELDWPAISVEWWLSEFSDRTQRNEEESLHYVCYGTNTSG